MVPPGNNQVSPVTHFVDWVDVILIGWVVISAVITPLVGRWLGRRFSASAESKFTVHEPTSFNARHDTADV
jgi:hypothetical protein